MEVKDRVRSARFEDRKAADEAYQAALARGYTPDDINVLMSDETKRKYYSDPEGVAQTETGDKSMEGLALGGALGGTVVGTIAAVVALSTAIVIPGLNLVVAGPLAAGLMGLGAGSVAGGLLGALVGAGIPEDRAVIYQDGIKKGHIILTVRSRDGSDDELLEDWKARNGRDIY